MKTVRPRWVLWAVATVAVWMLWVTFVYMPLQRRDTQEQSLRTEWGNKHRSMMKRIETAPLVMAQIKSLEDSLASAAGALPTAHELNEFMAVLGEMGRQSGVSTVEAHPELASMLNLCQSNASGTLMMDTLSLELSATGRFHSLAEWMERVETHPAFCHWRLIRWDKGDSPGTVTIEGFASVLVAVPPEARS